MKKRTTHLLKNILIVSLLLWSWVAPAQSSFCENPGDRYTLIYTGPDTFYVGSNCMATITIPPASITFSPILFSGFVPFTPPGGYGVGDVVPAGTVVDIHYIIWGGSPVVYDTLCFQLTYLDSSAPVINTTLINGTTDCGLEPDYTSWLQDQFDLLAIFSSDNCGVDTIYHNGPLTFPANTNLIDVTFFVEDFSGNISSTTASYSLLDTFPPDFDIPVDITIECHEDIDTTALGGISNIVDNCNTINSVEFNEITSNVNCAERTIVRSWTVTDAVGNSRTKSQTIVVQDSNGDCEETFITWTGIYHVWSLPQNWNLGYVPLPCNNVIIPSGIVLVPIDTPALGKTLDVHLGARLEVPLGSTMQIGW